MNSFDAGARAKIASMAGFKRALKTKSPEELRAMSKRVMKRAKTGFGTREGLDRLKRGIKVDEQILHAERKRALDELKRAAGSPTRAADAARKRAAAIEKEMKNLGQETQRASAVLGARTVEDMRGGGGILGPTLAIGLPIAGLGLAYHYRRKQREKRR